MPHEASPWRKRLSSWRLRLPAGAGAQEKLLRKGRAGGVQQITQIQAIRTLAAPGTPNPLSSKDKGEKLSAPRASRANCKAKRAGGQS